MAAPRLLGWIPAAALAVCAWTACNDKGASPMPMDNLALGKRCEQLAKACGDSDKHIQKIAEECKRAAEKEARSGCTEKVIAAYDCYEKELCGKQDKVWTLDDLRVLSERHSKCVTARNAVRTCVAP